MIGQFARIGSTYLDDGTWVSTVRLAWVSPRDRVDVFETRVFGGRLNQGGGRYETVEQATSGHELWVGRARMARAAA